MSEENLHEDFDYDDFDDDEFCFDDCPKCGRHYDETERDFQWCSKCGWDEEKKTWGEKREPNQQDYLSGDADILTGRFY